MRLRFIITEVFQGLRRNTTMAFSVIIVTLVSLAFVGAAALLQTQVGKLKDDWYDKVEVSIFLCPNVSVFAQCKAGPVTDAQQEEIIRVLETGALGDIVEQVYPESKEEAWENLLKRDPDGFFAQQLTADDMQPSLRVKLKDPEQFALVADAVGELDGVEHVFDQREVFDTLFQILNRATLLAAALAVVMLLAAMLLITTTIRLSALSRRRETTIMRMVGSSKTLIQLPFMLEGVIAATTGAVLSIIGLWLTVRYLVQDWLVTSNLNWVDYIDQGDVLAVAPWLILIALGLSAVSSLVTLGRYTSA
ncbi:MAG: ABC transporter permease [Demequinaceae bacterium]|nr:ABC transporter permease [Demequinaceae bacterium]